MTAKISKGIDIHNVGPNGHVHVPLVPGGGVVVMVGMNDTGKTEALRAINALTGRKERLTVKRDSPPGTKGRVVGGGIELTISSSARRKGEAEFEVLAGNLSMADLVDPGIKSHEAADAQRIKALVMLAGTKSNVDLFYRLFQSPESFWDTVGPIPDDDADLVTLAGHVKRAIEAQARNAEALAEKMMDRSRARSFEHETINLLAPDDADDLQRRLEVAIRDESSLVERRKQTEISSGRAAHARNELDSVDKDAMTLRQASEAVTNAKRSFDSVAVLAENLRSQTREIEAKLACEEQSLQLAVGDESSAKGREELIDRCRRIIDDAKAESFPSDQEITDSKRATKEAREAIETGVLVRHAKQQASEAKCEVDGALETSKYAESLRRAAGGTDDVLSDVVAKLGCPLRVVNGRLLVTADGSEKYYAELSQGARWKMALDIGINAVGKGGLLPIPQEAWEGLDYENRRLISEHVEGSEVNIITAESAKTPEQGAGGVTAEVFQKP